ncbi:aminotransferase class I/II-fold pyridoxal phosphate-dependent enzyme [Mesoflavibacter zeaxanthinifaciens]|uniref:aminotransferase class I/II-fold pyridoxal phosphate-dependent enzyme n=1 Tax=Mesoflavibacter zeaxanthinifaciens TaxID=393060 RepID=UPI003A8F4093
MAKIKHNNFMNTVDEVIGHAKAQGVVHLYAEDTYLNGRHLTIDGNLLYHFGTTGYLGLEQDVRLKKAAIQAITKYGTQFPLSKTYISHPLYAELEEKLTTMYNHPIVITKNSTLGHMAVIPCAVDDLDAVIIDHQVHWSVQQATQLLRLRDIPVGMIRHNNMNMLEDRIKQLKGRYNHIWYMADGVYSMYGDVAPIDDLKSLCALYPQLRLYYDDVHGMSWKGQHGTGFIMNAYGTLPENVLVFGTLSKTFGASGAVLVCPDVTLHRKIKNFGGPLTFSAQLEPSAVAAAVASAKIHLSDEIYDLQDSLISKVKYFNRLLTSTNLPLIESNNTPVFYIGTGMPVTGYRFVKRLMNAGFFVNLGLYPAVPVKNTGVRITVSRHNKKADICALVDAMSYHYPKALAETQTTMSRVYKLFKKEYTLPSDVTEVSNTLKLDYKTHITAIDKTFWNRYMGHDNFDWDGLKFLETVFKAHPELTHRWAFHYFIVTDADDNPVVMTYFTTTLTKDDMLTKASVSKKIEAIRASDPLYLSSKVTGMGTLFTTGSHCFIARNHALWQSAFSLIFNALEDINKAHRIGVTMLRDFLKDDAVLNPFFHDKGFVKVDLPDRSRITKVLWKDTASYIASLTKRSRRHFNKDIAPFTEQFNIAFKSHLSSETLADAYVLYQSVAAKNYGLNTFTYPFDLFEQMNTHPNWEFITLHLQDEQQGKMRLVGVMFCYKNEKGAIYIPSLIGMDYEFVRSHNVYRQLLFQTVQRAIQLSYTSIDFGVTAAFEKQKIGAINESMVAFVQADDNYTMALVDSL